MLYPNPVFSTLTGLQTGTIPPGIHTFYINIQSGAANVNGITYWAPQIFQGGALDSKMILMPTGSIGLSGIAGCRVNYFYL